MQAPPPPDPPALIRVASTEPFDPREAQEHPLRALPESLCFHSPGRAVQFHPGQRPPLALPARPSAIPVAGPRARPWLDPIPDGLVALALDLVVAGTGGHGSLLATGGNHGSTPGRP